MAQTFAQLVKGISAVSAPANSLNIDSSGRVGIGITNPSVSLQVGNGSGLQQAYISGGGYDLYLGASGGGAFGFSSQTASLIFNNTTVPICIGTLQSQPLAFGTANNERVRIDSSGRLLVGTSSARSNFFNTTNITPGVQIENTDNSGAFSIVRQSNDTGGAFIALCKSRGTAVGANTLVSNGDDLGGLFFLGSDGTEFVAGAGITGQVDGTPGANDMPGRLVFSTTADGASSPTERMRITQDGFTTFGTAGTTILWNQTAVKGVSIASGSNGSLMICRDSDTLQLLNRTGSNGDILNFYKSAVFVGSISVTGTATTYGTVSDYRLKENVVPLAGAVDRLNQLQVHRFNFIADPSHTVDGFLAHEAQAVVPECVTGTKDEMDADGNPVYQGIDQSKLVPLLTAALQEAIAEIASLKDRVAALEAS
jgi:hypothetical protein